MNYRFLMLNILWLPTIGMAIVGKTHFIVGHEDFVVPQKEAATVSQPVQSTHTHSVDALFSTDTDLSKKLQELINREKTAIKIAVYMMSDPDIANALIAACNRGVKVELVSDAGCLKERSNKLTHLCENGCAVYIYDSSNPSHLMHHKFALFNDSCTKQTVWTGSYNFTKAAKTGNQENAIVLVDAQSYKKFEDQFERLKKQSHRYGGTGRN